MRSPLLRFSLLVAGAATLLARPAAAQDKTAQDKTAQDKTPDQNRCDCGSLPHVMRAFSYHTRDDNRAALGLATTSGSHRDTLGLLVTDVTSGGPAEKAGIEEGDRLQAVNGVDLRISPADAGDREMHGLMAHRLIRTLAKVKPGDAVELRVYSDGKVRTVKVVTAKASELFKDDGMLRLGSDWFEGPGRMEINRLDDRMQRLRHRLGDLRYKVGPERFEITAPDIEWMAPDEAPPPPGSVPSRHFMRIGTPGVPLVPPAAPAPPASPTPPSPPRPPLGPSTLTI